MEMPVFGHRLKSMITRVYVQLIVWTISNRDIDQKNAVNNFEITLTPRCIVMEFSNKRIGILGNPK
jgi:hypothetical protein